MVEIMKLARVEEESQVSRMTQCEEDHFEMLVRASNIVRPVKSLHCSCFLLIYICDQSGSSWRIVDEACYRSKAISYLE